MQIFLNIIIFISALLLVICIHELGHFLVAKACNVYCFEYSIGFGPALFKHKFKHKKKTEHKKVNKDDPLFSTLTEGLDKKSEGIVEKVEGETQFTIRLLPLGGYVSMAGEDDDEGDIKVPKNRTLTGVNHFKQISIMLAGIAMNFLLCFILFFISFSFCPQTLIHNDINQVDVVEDSPIYEKGLRTGDKITSLYQVYENLYDPETKKDNISLEFPASEDRVELKTYGAIYESDATEEEIKEAKNIAISYAAQDVLNSSENNIGLAAISTSTRTIHFTYVDSEGNSHTVDDLVLKTSLVDNRYVFQSMGISQFTTSFTYGPKDGIQIAGRQFGNLFVGIYQALGNLFTPSGWENIGGLISVYKMSAQGVESGSIAYVLYLWGYISLNLGCFNLLPIPGLDGWQTLIALGETITRKKAPQKFKAIANTVGLLLLLGLGVVLIVKDIIMF